MAQARAHLEDATDGLDADATVAHLEATVAQAAIEASRLGISFPASEASGDPLALGDGEGSIVVVQRLPGSDQPS